MLEKIILPTSFINSKGYSTYYTEKILSIGYKKDGHTDHCYIKGTVFLSKQNLSNEKWTNHWWGRGKRYRAYISLSRQKEG